MKTRTSLIFGFALFTSLNAFADRTWNEANSPSQFEGNYQYNFFKLPIGGSLDSTNKGWSDSYWPMTRGWIADRWQNPDPEYQADPTFKFKDYRLVNASQINSLTQNEINILSPAEKFDLIRGKYDFPVAKKLKSANPGKKDWWRGLCDGWSTSSLNIDEPHPVNFKSPVNGINVPLASSDIKGLIAYFYAKVEKTARYQFVGKACRNYKRLFFDIGGACDDTNPAAFHVIVANEIGLRKRGLAIDRDSSPETWNHPFVGFATEVTNIKTFDLSKRKSKDAVKEVYVTTTMKYVNELYQPSAENIESDYNVAPQVAALGMGKSHYDFLKLEYVLELNANDQIIGGEWLGSGKHPDFLWRLTPGTSTKYVGSSTRGEEDDWSILSNIVKMATQYARGNLKHELTEE